MEPTSDSGPVVAGEVVPAVFDEVKVVPSFEMDQMPGGGGGGGGGRGGR